MWSWDGSKQDEAAAGGGGHGGAGGDGATCGRGGCGLTSWDGAGKTNDNPMVLLIMVQVVGGRSSRL